MENRTEKINIENQAEYNKRKREEMAGVVAGNLLWIVPVFALLNYLGAIVFGGLALF